MCGYDCYRGAGPGCNTREISDRLMVLKEELDELERRERELDEHKSWVQQSIKNVTDDVSNHQYPFVVFIQPKGFVPFCRAIFLPWSDM